MERTFTMPKADGPAFQAELEADGWTVIVSRRNPITWAITAEKVTETFGDKLRGAARDLNLTELEVALSFVLVAHEDASPVPTWAIDIVRDVVTQITPELA